MSSATDELCSENAKLRACLGDGCADCALGMGEYADKLCDPYKAENAKLRQQLADVTESMGRVEERCAKLRELVKSMYFDLSHMTFPPDWVTDYVADMRELGIEVD